MARAEQDLYNNLLHDLHTLVAEKEKEASEFFGQLAEDPSLSDELREKARGRQIDASEAVFINSLSAILISRRMERSKSMLKRLGIK